MKKKSLIFAFAAAFLLAACASPAQPEANDPSSLVTYYTVTFDSDGGSPVESIRVEEGKRIPRPTNPTIDHGAFRDWTLMNGSVQLDQTIRISEGASEDWHEDYLGDSWPYLLCSDATFKANWAMEKKEFELWYSNSSSYSQAAIPVVESAAGSYAFEDSYYTGVHIERFGPGDDLVRRMALSAAAGLDCPDLFVYRWVNGYEPGTPDYEFEKDKLHTNIKDLCAPLSQENATWVQSHFAEEAYQDMLIDDVLYGFPMFTGQGQNRAGEPMEYYYFVSAFSNPYFANPLLKTDVSLDIAQHISAAFL